MSGRRVHIYKLQISIVSAKSVMSVAAETRISAKSISTIVTLSLLASRSPTEMQS